MGQLLKPLATLCLIAVLAVACGDASDQSNSAQSTSEQSTSAPSTSEQPAATPTAEAHVPVFEARPPPTPLPHDPGGSPTPLPEPQRPAAPPPTTGSGSWVLGEVPTGFVAVMVTDRHGRRDIYYQRESASRDLYNSPITVSVSHEPGRALDPRPGSERVSVHGGEGWRFELHGDGAHYGTAVAWQDGQGRHVTVAWAELVPPDEVLALANQTIEVSSEDWSRLRGTIGSEVVIQD